MFNAREPPERIELRLQMSKSAEDFKHAFSLLSLV
jgi:hypothetical protein